MDTKKRDEGKAIEDLKTIRTFLEEGRKSLDENGFQFMFWGALIPIATILFSFVIINNESLSFLHTWFWPIIGGIGFIASFVYGSKKSSRRKVYGFADRLVVLLWTGYGLMIIAFVLLSLFSGLFNKPILLSIIALSLGLVYWIHGSLLQITWFRLLGIPWWSTAVIISFLSWQTAPLVMAIATFLCSFLPGVVLAVKHNRENR